MTQTGAVRSVLRFRSRPRRRPWRQIALVAAAALALVLLGLLALTPSRIARTALQEELWRNDVPPDVVSFYEARGLRPLWMSRSPFSAKGALKPEARTLVAMIQHALPGEVPEAARRRVQAALQATQAGTPEAAARAEVALSLALGDWVRSTQQTPAGVQLAFTDPDFRRSASAADALEAAASAPSLAEHLAALRDINPVYSSLRDAYLAYRKTHGPGDYEPLVLANLQRARVLPPLTADRFILVNVPAGELQLHANGQSAQAMKVVVGTRREETPMMAGLMRYVVFNPYWELPVDMVRESIAPRVLKSGAGYFRASNLEILSDWGDQARVVEPEIIDWAAVAAGTIDFPVRQRPGGDNMMGQAKFMLPNELGIYLHDTPNKGVFQSNARLLSAGCVRLERAQEVSAWLFAGRPPTVSGTNQRVDLKSPVPVYITYLTVTPGANNTLVFHPDVYGKDPALLEAMRSGRPLAPAPKPSMAQVAQVTPPQVGLAA